MDWIKGIANYMRGTIWYYCDYTINQQVTCIDLFYKDIFVASRPNWNMNGVKELKEIGEKHYKEQQLIKELIRIAKTSTNVKNKVGALLVRDGEIISSAANGAPIFLDDADMLYQTTLHAEERAILRACDSTNCGLYVTLSPCPKCAAIILESGIKEVYYLFEYSEMYGVKYLNDNNVMCKQLHHNLKLKPFNLEPL